jgi:hypothetical protein
MIRPSAPCSRVVTVPIQTNSTSSFELIGVSIAKTNEEEYTHHKCVFALLKYV